jgi:hypothetical protein
MPSFISAHKKLKARSTSKRRKTRLVKRKGTIQCVCKKAKGNQRDLIVGGKLITRKELNSPVNHIRFKRAKHMNEDVWTLTGGVDNPCKCKLLSGTDKKSRVLKGINMVVTKYR